MCRGPRAGRFVRPGREPDRPSPAIEMQMRHSTARFNRELTVAFPAREAPVKVSPAVGSAPGYTRKPLRAAVSFLLLRLGVRASSSISRGWMYRCQEPGLPPFYVDKLRANRGESDGARPRFRVRAVLETMAGADGLPFEAGCADGSDLAFEGREF